MWKPGVLELVIVLVIVLLVLGADRIGKLGKGLGEGIREFREGLSPGGRAAEEEASEEE
jgi:sec-independent protein translocase protein TatA